MVSVCLHVNCEQFKPERNFLSKKAKRLEKLVKSNLGHLEKVIKIGIDPGVFTEMGARLSATIL